MFIEGSFSICEIEVISDLKVDLSKSAIQNIKLYSLNGKLINHWYNINSE